MQASVIVKVPSLVDRVELAVEINLHHLYMSLNENIQNWVRYSNKMKELQQELNSLREKKNIEEHTIISIAESKQLLNNNIKVDCGIMKFCNTNKYAPLTLQYIHSCLANIIEDSEQAELILNYIKENRQVSRKLNIKLVNSI